MGLWDILVPSEPGVLHNLIANPSFEYDNNEVNDIEYTINGRNALGFPLLSKVTIDRLRKLPNTVGTKYWYGNRYSTITRSATWGSRGASSLECASATSPGLPRAVYYAPKLTAPSYFNTTISASWYNNGLDNGNISTAKTTYIAVVGLTDIGMSLTNGVVDTQVYLSPSDVNNLIAYPTIDALRGHMKPLFTTLAASGSNNYAIQVSVTGFSEEVVDTVRGWAVFVSQDTTSSKTYVLCGIIPSSRKNWATVGGVYTTPNEYQLVIGNIPYRGEGATPIPATPTLGTGKLYMFPLGTNGKKIVRGNGTSFLSEFQHTAADGLTNGLDLYVVFDGQPSNKKQFLGRIASRGTANSVGTLTCTSGSTSVSLTGFPFGFDIVGKALYVGSDIIGIVESASSSTAVTLESAATVTHAGVSYSYSVDSQTEIQLDQDATQIVVDVEFYYASETNPQSFPNNNFGAISTFITDGTTYLPASMGKDCSTPFFGVTNNSFPVGEYKHHLYFDWYLDAEATSPNSTYSGTGADWSVYLVNTKSDSVVTTETISITAGNTEGSVSGTLTFGTGALLFTSEYDFIGEVLLIDVPTGYFKLANPARFTVSSETIRYVSESAGTLLGTLDDATATDSAAYRMKLRKKFLINRPSGDTSDMMLKFQCGITMGANLYLDGVQFVDVGMIWRSYDFYTSSPYQYTNPPQFSDWNWNDVEFSYIDGDIPGAIWSDTMPTQSGTTAVGWPFFSDNGVWMQEVWNGYITQETSQGGYASPTMREQWQWRNAGKPVYGVSVPGLSQSSLIAPTFETGFWAPFDTDNINVVVEPTISGSGMPEIATTALEYGIVDGGFVQRQVARMRNMQFTVTISAQSWTGLHANRRSLINLLKFDQLAQQGERLLRYRGATTPVVAKITYVGGLEFNGVQTQSFTETLGLRFLSSDPYFYTEVPLTQNISPTDIQANNSSVYYKLGNNSEWRPLGPSYSQIEMNDGTYSPFSKQFWFFMDKFATAVTPKAMGWLQSSSGNVSTLVVGGDFEYPFPTLAFFYVSGFRPDTTTAAETVQFVSVGGARLTMALNDVNGSYSEPIDTITAGQFIYTLQGIYIGRIVSVNTTLRTLVIDNNVHPAYSNAQFYLVKTQNINADAPPLMVYGRRLFQLDGGDSAVTTSVNDIYQESANSILVVGDFYRVTEIGMNQPNTNVNTTNTYRNKGIASSRVVSNDIPYAVHFRVARFVMNDNGKIVVYPADSQFNNVNSTLYELIKNRPINSVTKSPSGQIVIGAGPDSQVDLYDVIDQQEYFQYPVMRGPSAYAVNRYQASVATINPQGELTAPTTSSTVNVGFVGFNLGTQRTGTITTNSFSVTSKFIVSASSGVFTDDDIGKSIYTLSGLYIGQIYTILKVSDADFYSSTAVLCEPAKVTVINAKFITIPNIQSLTTDNRSANATIIAATISDDTTEYRTSVWAYVPNPLVSGRLSLVQDSYSFGYSGDLDASIGVGSTGLINAATNSAIIKGQNTNFTDAMIGNLLATLTGDIIGKVKSVESTTRLTLAQNAAVDAGGLVPSNFALTKGLLSTSATSITTIIASTNSFLSTDAGKYLYLYDANSKRLTYVGLIASYVSGKQITVSSNSIGTAFSKIKGVVSTVAFYVEYNVRSQKLFTAADGYISKTGYIETVNSTLGSGSLYVPANSTTSSTQYTGFDKNAPTVFADTTSATVILNGENIDTGTMTDSILRRNFSADTTVAPTIFDPSNTNNERTAYGAYSFGWVKPFLNTSPTSGTLTFYGKYVYTTGTLLARSLLFVNYNNECIVFVGYVSGVTETINGVTYYRVEGVDFSAFEYTFTVTQYWNPSIGIVLSLPTGYDLLNWDSMRTALIQPPNGSSYNNWRFNQNTIKGAYDSIFLNAQDIGRSAYLQDGSSYKYVGIIKNVQTLADERGFYTLLTVSPSASIATSSSINGKLYLSGGTKYGTPNGVTWYPYQFGVRGTISTASELFAIEDTGMESSITYTGSGASGAPACTSAGIITVDLQLTSDYQCPAPTGLTANAYDLYAYISGWYVSNVYDPSQVGQWLYVGEITATTSSSISYRATSSGAGNTIGATSGSTDLTVSGTPTAQTLVGCNIYRSDTGAFIGRIIDASSSSRAILYSTALSTYSGTYYYSFAFPTNTNTVRGTPLSIVNRLTIYTNSPAAYEVGDELLAYAATDDQHPRYIGTVQKIISTSAGVKIGSVTLSYYPVWYSDEQSILNGSNAPFINVNLNDWFSGIYSGNTTIYRATKSVRGSQSANYFANVVGKIISTTTNPRNASQLSHITLPTSFTKDIPTIYQAMAVPTTTFTTNTATNVIDMSTESVTQSQSLASVDGSTTITTVGTTVPVRQALFRQDGKLIGYNANTATTLVANPAYHTNGNPQMYSYMPVAANATPAYATITTTAGSTAVTLVVNGTIFTAEYLVGRALYALSPNTGTISTNTSPSAFIGIVSHATSATNLVLQNPAPYSRSANRFAVSNIISEVSIGTNTNTTIAQPSISATITATAGSTATTRKGKIDSFGWSATSPGNLTYNALPFADAVIFTLNNTFVGVVATAADATDVMTLRANAENSATNEPFIYMYATTATAVSRCFTTTTSTTATHTAPGSGTAQPIPTNARGCAIFRVTSNSTNTNIITPEFVGIIASISGGVATFLNSIPTFPRTFFASPLGDKPTACAPSGIINRVGSITTTIGSKQFTLSFPNGVVNGCAADDMPGKAVFDGTTGALIGIVKYADDAYTGYLVDNATVAISNGAFFWAPTSLASVMATENRVKSITPNRQGSITAVAGAPTITVTGLPDAYSLVNKTIYAGNGTLIGVGASANSYNTLVLAANALTSTTDDTEYTYSASTTDGSNIPLSTVAKLYYTPTSAFTAPLRAISQTSAVWRNTGKLIGFVGNVTGNTVQFLNMPFTSTLGAEEPVIVGWTPNYATAANPPSVHYPLNYYNSWDIGEIVAGSLSFTTSFANPSWLVGAALYVNSIMSIDGPADTEEELYSSLYAGRVASVSGTTVTLIAPAQASGYVFFASYTPYILVVNTPNAIGRAFYDKFNNFIGIVDDIAYNNMGALTSPARTWVGASYQQSTLGIDTMVASAPSSYIQMIATIKYSINVGDVLRKTTNEIIGQVWKKDIANKKLYLLENSRHALSSANVLVHHKPSNSRFVGEIVGTITSFSYSDDTRTYATILGSGTRFSEIPYDLINRGVVNPYDQLYTETIALTQGPTSGTELYVSINGTYVRLGVIFEIHDDTVMTIAVSLEGQALGAFGGQSYSAGYSILNSPGLGGVVTSQTGFLAAFTDVSGTPQFQSFTWNRPTKFTEQLIQGMYVVGESSAFAGYVHSMFSDSTIGITNEFGGPYSGSLANPPYRYNIVYRYDESLLWDYGEQVYVNNDWQPFGAQNGKVIKLTTTQNGTIIASGTFTKWSDISDTNNTSSRNVGGVAKVVPLIADGVMFDGYVAPLVGSSYNNNGFNGEVFVVKDITDINPVTGFIGSSERLLIGGSFEQTRNGEDVSTSIAIAEGASLSGNLQSIVSADIEMNPRLVNKLMSVNQIAVSTRLRKYYTNPQTNYLDGINGVNLAIATSVTQLLRTTQYYSLRIRGNASAYPIIVIRNLVATAKLYELVQTETGARIRFANNGLDVLEYEVITINCIPGQRSISSSIRGNLLSFVHPSTNFVDWVLLGANNSAGKSVQSFDDYRVNVVGVHADVGLQITISYTPKFWSFDANNMFFGTTKANL